MQKITPVPIEQYAGWAKELVWEFLEKRKISSLFQESNP
jgi:hypothetical protein